MIEYIVLTRSDTEFRRVKRSLENKKVDFHTRNKNFLIYEKSEEVENLLKMWCRKYGTKVYKLKEWL